MVLIRGKISNLLLRTTEEPSSWGPGFRISYFLTWRVDKFLTKFPLFFFLPEYFDPHLTIFLFSFIYQLSNGIKLISVFQRLNLWLCYLFILSLCLRWIFLLLFGLFFYLLHLFEGVRISIILRILAVIQRQWWLPKSRRLLLTIMSIKILIHRRWLEIAPRAIHAKFYPKISARGELLVWIHFIGVRVVISTWIHWMEMHQK